MVGSSSKEMKREKNLRNKLFNGFKFPVKSCNDPGSVIDL